MSKDEAQQIIQAVPQLTQEEKDELVGKLKHKTVTSTEMKAIAKTIQGAIDGIDEEIADLEAGGANSLKAIYEETEQRIDDAAADYAQDIADIQKQSSAVFSQAADYLDRITAEDLKKKVE